MGKPTEGLSQLLHVLTETSNLKNLFIETLNHQKNFFNDFFTILCLVVASSLSVLTTTNATIIFAINNLMKLLVEIHIISFNYRYLWSK
jgi:hypothetical protein